MEEWRCGSAISKALDQETKPWKLKIEWLALWNVERLGMGARRGDIYGKCHWRWWSVVGLIGHGGVDEGKRTKG